MFSPKAYSLCSVDSICEKHSLNTKKAPRAQLYGGAPDSVQADNSYIVGLETEISQLFEFKQLSYGE